MRITFPVYACFSILINIIVNSFLFTDSAKAQTFTLQGFITDGTSGQILPGANITLIAVHDEDMFYGTATDRNGFYSISTIAPGRYTLRITYLGYITREDTLSLSDGNVPQRTLNATLMPDVEQLETLIVTVQEGAVRQSAGHQRVRPADLSRVPTPGGSGDLVSYLQIQPGVVAAADRGGQLFIRGGTPSQNMVLMDGMMVYQPFHIIGFFSAFPENLVTGADFHSGGFGSRYSGRVSSVIDVQMRDGHMYHYHGSASVSPFLGEVQIEGPLRKGNISWIASVRHSLIEQTSSAFLTSKQPLLFQSHYAKISHTEESLWCSATFLHTYDRGRMDFGSDDTVNWNNLVLGARCLAAPGAGALLDFNVSFSRLSNTMDVGFSELFSSVNRFTINGHVTQPVGKITVGYGAYTLYKFLNYDIREMLFTPHAEEEEFIGGGLHAEAVIPAGGNIYIQPGAALNLIPGMYRASLEPRLKTWWNPNGDENRELSMAFGIYRQPVVGVADRRDVSSVFTAWMPGPIGESQKEAIHALAGWSQKFSSGFQWSIDGFYKNIRNHPVTEWSTNAQFITDLTLAHGHVYGGDVRVEYTGNSIHGSAGYGYTWTEYRSAQQHFNTWFGEPVQYFHPPHDRRHQISAQLAVDMGPYTVSIGWQLGSGLPYTQPFGFDDRIPFEGRLPDVLHEPGIPRILMEKPYNRRLPVYHRLDISTERKFNIKGTRLYVQAGAVNLYNHSNIFYYDVYTQRRIDQLPLAPWVSFKTDI